VAELVRHDQRAHGADGVGKEGLRTVEGVDVARPEPRPAAPATGDHGALHATSWRNGRLHGAGDLERELAEVHLVDVRRDAALALRRRRLP
jgi:hypothetical protein